MFGAGDEASALLLSLATFGVAYLARPLGAVLMASLLALATPSLLTALLETLPPGFRAGGIGIIYALAISVFGGTTQLVVAWLIAVTDSPLAPAGYMAAALLLALAGAAAMRETAPVRVARELT